VKALTFDRWDFLATKVVLVVVAIATPIATLVVPLSDWARGKPLVWTVDTGVVDAVPSGRIAWREGATARGTGDAVVTIHGAGGGTWLASMLPGLVLCVATVIVAFLCFQLLRRIQAGEPFGAGSVTILRLTAVIVISGTFLVSVAGSFADVLIMNRAVENSSAIAFSVTGEQIVLVAVGLLVAAMAEAFAQGERIRRDVEGLV
jgi:uncharacterized protein (UPF0261 family)